MEVMRNLDDLEQSLRRARRARIDRATEYLDAAAAVEKYDRLRKAGDNQAAFAAIGGLPRNSMLSPARARKSAAEVELVAAGLQLAIDKLQSFRNQEAEREAKA